jgi:3-oxoacid CoA-transferase subunit A
LSVTHFVTLLTQPSYRSPSLHWDIFASRLGRTLLELDGGPGVNWHSSDIFTYSSGTHSQAFCAIEGSFQLNKVFPNAATAVADIPDGATLMVGGFGLSGIPENLIAALVERGVRNLRTISNNMGIDRYGMGRMLETDMVVSHIGSYVGENKLLELKVLRGELDLTLIPQGTLAERIRAGGAGIPAFYTPAGVGTLVADGKETREFEGKPYLLESWLRADFALIKAWKGDTAGNLVYRKTARNFNPMMATAARITIAEVEELVEPGEIDPDHVITPGIYVKRILKGESYEKHIERRTVRAAG